MSSFCETSFRAILLIFQNCCVKRSACKSLGFNYSLTIVLQKKEEENKALDPFTLYIFYLSNSLARNAHYAEYVNYK